MGLDSILGFIVIAIISALFNQDKGKKRSQKRKSPTTTAMPQEQAIEAAEAMVEETPARNLLEEMLREFQKELAPNLPSKKEAPLSQKKKSGTLKGIKQGKPPKQPVIPEETFELDYSEIEMSEADLSVNKPIPCKERERLECHPRAFTRESILNGVIMAEILGKPKALRNGHR